MMHQLAGCQNVSIYLGNVCNFNCTYCDRDYIKQSIGGQHMVLADVEHVKRFLIESGLTTQPPKMFSFHGGEPFSYVKIMDKMMDMIAATVPGDYPFYIQTNGSQILEHQWFFEKWGSKLDVSISYDFLYQDLNRSKFEIVPTIQMMQRSHVRGIQFQYVMPIADSKVFSLTAIKAITDICLRNGVRRLNLIPLRHIRGKDKFDVIVDRIDLAQFFDAFLKFIHILYTMEMDVIVDGHGEGFDKHYFSNHKLMVLSPDGHIYPEYDFLEYKNVAAAIGTWKNEVSINRVRSSEDELLNAACVTCPSKTSCGLKYLHGMFGTSPTSQKCAQFYEMMNVIIHHTQTLKQQPSFFHWIYAATNGNTERP